MAAIISWLHAVLLIAIAFPVVGRYGPEGVAAAKLTGGLALTVLISLGIARFTEVTVKDIAARIWRPMAASAVMAVAVASVPASTGGVPVDLILKVLVGLSVYSAAVLLFWRLAGCPDGAERFFLGQLGDRLAR
jgi:hypothetical protein